MLVTVLDHRVKVFQPFPQFTRDFRLFDTVENRFVVFVDQDDDALAGFFVQTSDDFGSVSTSNPTTARLSLLNSTPIKWIGWPRARYLSA